MEENNAQYFPIIDYLTEHDNTMNNVYYINFPKKCDIFLLVHYNYGDFLQEFCDFLTASILKMPTDAEKRVLIKHVSEYISDSVTNTAWFQHRLFLNNFEKHMEKSYEYYEKYSVKSAFETLNIATCDVIQMKNWQYILTYIGTIKYLLSEHNEFIANYCRDFVENKDVNFYTMHTLVDKAHAYELFELILDQDNEIISSAIDHAIFIFNKMLTSIAPLFSL